MSQAKAVDVEDICVNHHLHHKQLREQQSQTGVSMRKRIRWSAAKLRKARAEFEKDKKGLSQEHEAISDSQEHSTEEALR